MNKFVYWVPRVASILFIIFISLFALDAFQEKAWALALFIHLIPSFILIFLTTIAWKHEQWGGYMFIFIGFLLLILSRFEPLAISIPLIIIGILFVGRKYFTS